MPIEDKSGLLKIVKYQCEVSEGFEASGKSTHIHTVYTYTLTSYIFEYTRSQMLSYQCGRRDRHWEE